MAIAILGKKIGMTQIFDEDGNRIPVTVIEAGPCRVLQKKSAQGPDGYDAIVLGYEPVKPKSKNKPELGQFKRWNSPPMRYVREIRVTPEEAQTYPNPGEDLTVSQIFKVGEKIDVTGYSRGRGFQGVMKRWGMAGAPDSHGTHEYFRHPGSIGCRTTPGRVFKGKRMPGHFGNQRVTVLNLKVEAIFPDKNIIMVRGAVPGAPKGLLILRRAVKVRAKRQSLAA